MLDDVRRVRIYLKTQLLCVSHRRQSNAVQWKKEKNDETVRNMNKMKHDRRKAVLVEVNGRKSRARTCVSNERKRGTAEGNQSNRCSRKLGRFSRNEIDRLPVSRKPK